jgi:hypothetical protein
MEGGVCDIDRHVFPALPIAGGWTIFGRQQFEESASGDSHLCVDGATLATRHSGGLERSSRRLFATNQGVTFVACGKCTALRLPLAMLLALSSSLSARPTASLTELEEERLERSSELESAYPAVGNLNLSPVRS